VVSQITSVVVHPECSAATRSDHEQGNQHYASGNPDGGRGHAGETRPGDALVLYPFTIICEGSMPCRGGNPEGKMDAELRRYLEEMEGRIGANVSEKCEEVRAERSGRLDRAAEAVAVDVGHLHGEIRTVVDRVRKMDANVTTCLEMLVRQSRWHDGRDSKAIDLLVRVNAMEKRVLDLEGRK
jgi:hypothetical protein